MIHSILKKYIVNNIITIIDKYVLFYNECIYSKQIDTSEILITQDKYDIIIKHSDQSIEIFNMLTKTVTLKTEGNMFNFTSGSHKKIYLFKNNIVWILMSGFIVSFNKLTHKYAYRNGIDDGELEQDFHNKYIMYYSYENNNLTICDPDTLNIDFLIKSADKIMCATMSNKYVVIAAREHVDIYKKINNKFIHFIKRISNDNRHVQFYNDHKILIISKDLFTIYNLKLNNYTTYENKHNFRPYNIIFLNKSIIFIIETHDGIVYDFVNGKIIYWTPSTYNNNHITYDSHIYMLHNSIIYDYKNKIKMIKFTNNACSNTTLIKCDSVKASGLETYTLNKKSFVLPNNRLVIVTYDNKELCILY
jgi:hypothetical protein